MLLRAPADGRGLCIVPPLGGGTATVHPFEKIAQHGARGTAGDIVAVLATVGGFESTATAVATAA